MSSPLPPPPYSLSSSSKLQNHSNVPQSSKTAQPDQPPHEEGEVFEEEWELRWTRRVIKGKGKSPEIQNSNSLNGKSQLARSLLLQSIGIRNVIYLTLQCPITPHISHANFSLYYFNYSVPRNLPRQNELHNIASSFARQKTMNQFTSFIPYRVSVYHIIYPSYVRRHRSKHSIQD
jgi:hypothetical protein